MKTKLTLRLKKTTIERGKVFAKKHKTNLSGLFENYLDKITMEKDAIEITPLVRSLIGVVTGKSVKKKDYVDFLLKKYK